MAFAAIGFQYSRMNTHRNSISLTDADRSKLRAIVRQRKAPVLVWKRAQSLLLLDAGEDAAVVCRMLDIGPTVLGEWRGSFSTEGLSFLGLKDYSQRQGHLSIVQENKLKVHFSDSPARNADEICAYILAEYGQSYCALGAAKLMRRLERVALNRFQSWLWLAAHNATTVMHVATRM
jgi:hypothetical protein